MLNFEFPPIFVDFIYLLLECTKHYQDSKSQYSTKTYIQRLFNSFLHSLILCLSPFSQSFRLQLQSHLLLRLSLKQKRSSFFYYMSHLHPDCICFVTIILSEISTHLCKCGQPLYPAHRKDTVHSQIHKQFRKTKAKSRLLSPLFTAVSSHWPHGPVFQTSSQFLPYLCTC